MKKTALIIFILFFLLSFYAFATIEHTMSSIFKQLDVTETDLKEHIWSNIAYISFSYPNPKQLLNTSNSERESIVNIVGNFVKSYTKTEEFVSKYKEYIKSRKPEPPQKPESIDDIKSKQKEQIKKSIEEMETNKKKMPADQQAMFDNAIKSIQEQLKEMDNPNNPAYSKDVNNYIQQGYEQEMKDYKDKLAQWEKEYNGKPDELVKKWLTTFLESTSDIDFNAVLKDENGRKIFVNNEFQSKPQIWKLCFRAGKKTTEAARSFAQSWVNELTK
ncbi:MAG: hypothetical protein HQK78_17830 [Desulfobacterales bacterium]|nr:hypothetical protein [Desulfobacterales bacterium]